MATVIDIDDKALTSLRTLTAIDADDKIGVEPRALIATEIEGKTIFPLNTLIDPATFPIALFDTGSPISQLFDKISFTDPLLEFSDRGLRAGVVVVISEEFSVSVPGLDSVAIVIGGGGGLSAARVEAIVGDEPTGPPFRIGLKEIAVGLRVSADILRPLKPGTNEPDLDAETFDITLGEIDIEFDSEGNLDFEIGADVSIPRCMVGTTGVLLTIGSLRWLTPTTSDLPDSTPAGFTGVFFDDVVVEMPQLDSPLSAIKMDDVFLGTGGFSGIISRPGLTLEWNGSDFTGDLHGELFGFKGGVTNMSVEFRQNALVACDITGDIFIPYLNKRVGLSLGLDGAGGLTATAALPHSTPAETGVTTGSAGYLIHLDVANVISLDIASLRFKVPAGDVPRLGISGRVAPGAGALDFPPVEMTGLWIDTRGHIQTEGDGIKLPSKYLLNFHGFQLEISKLGFGNTEDGGKWISFNGGLKLIEGMPAGASVEGLRFTWHPNGDIDTTLKGVSVNFEIPNTLKFEGEVSFDADPQQQQFRGAIKLNLMALKMEVDATAVFKMQDGQPCLALYLAAEFPAGIPLFATGLGVYGMAGLFAMNMEPNKLPGESWYEMQSPGQPATDWYHKGSVGATSLSKWTTSPGRMAFGAGVTLGTVADNGHTFSGKMLLVIVIPGPVLMIQGSASILHERTALEGNDANFRAFAVLDGRAGTFTLGLDAQYRYNDSGSLIDIHGAAEGYFNFNDPSAWRLNVGLQEPRERRLTARLFNLFDAYAYVALDAHQLAMGAWIGFQQNWQFGPLSVGLEAWLDGNARVSWKPAHFYGDLALHGSAKLAVFGFGVGLTIDARIAADVFDPLHVLGQFNVAIDLPWPFTDIAVPIRLEWGPQPTRPPLPLPLKEVAIEHFKASSSWLLPRATDSGLLLPNYDANGDGFFDGPSGSVLPAPTTLVPVVPMDSRPHITFARNINDDALVGVNAMRVVPEFERIGDPVRNEGPARIRYGLQEVALQKLKDGAWTNVARKATDANGAGVPTLFGSWAPVPQMPGGGGLNTGQTKLWLWSKTPFEYSRRSSRAWDEWFTDEYDGYPCQSLAGTGWNFEQIDPGPLPMSWTHPDAPGLQFNSGENSVTVLSRPSHGLTHAFGITGRGRANMLLERPTNLIRIMITDSRLLRVSDFVGRDSGLGVFGAALGGTLDRPYIEIRGVNMNQIDYFPEVFLPIALTKNVATPMGGAYLPSLNQVIFVESGSGNITTIDPNGGDPVVLGHGYQRPQDIVVNAAGTVAYVIEQGGSLLKVDLTGNADRANATFITKGITSPHQIAFDEESAKAYVVEFASLGLKSRLLSIDLDGPTAGAQTVLATGFVQAVGVLVTADLSTAYVSEQGDGGRLLQVDLTTGKSTVVAEKLEGIFFLRWADAEQSAILAVLRGFGQLLRIDLKDPSNPLSLMEGTGFDPVSVILLPDNQYVTCCDNDVELFTTTLWIPKIDDVGGDLLVRHFEDELARWSQAGDVLEPHTLYRLKVKTQISARGEGQLAGYSVDQPVEEFAYFQTDGPPGVANLTAPISASASSSAPGAYQNPLDDLSRYVSKTLPRSVKETSQPFYRAYDVGIQFDENYVDLMYRLGRRDLSVHLYDGNGAMRDARGRRLVLANQWGRAEEVTLNEREERWLSVLGSNGCGLINVGNIVKDSTFTAPHSAHVMSASTLCEARLVPALLHDDFGNYGTRIPDRNGSFERWQVVDEPGSTSHWVIVDDGKPTPDFSMSQNEAKATTTLVYQNASGVTPSHSLQPSNWTDYRVTVSLRHSAGKIGVAFRYRDRGNHYRFVLDETGKSEIIRMLNGVPFSVATGQFAFAANQDRVVSVEAVGSSLRMSVAIEDHPELESVLEATDSAISSGSIGLFSSGTPDARFTDVYVDDYGDSAAVVYRHSFITSRFRNFVDHLNSFEKKTWRAPLSLGANVSSLIAQAKSPGEAVTDAESRAYDALLAQLPDVVSTPDVVQVTRVEQNSNAIAFLMQSPEALDWSRINLQLLRQSPVDKTYSELTVKVLRKIDGAGVFIVSPVSGGGSSLPPGEYRLVLTYRRDNRAFDSTSDVFSEAGNSGNEEVSLDIPWQT